MVASNNTKNILFVAAKETKLQSSKKVYPKFYFITTFKSFSICIVLLEMISIFEEF